MPAARRAAAGRLPSGCTGNAAAPPGTAGPRAAARAGPGLAGWARAGPGLAGCAWVWAVRIRAVRIRAGSAVPRTRILGWSRSRDHARPNPGRPGFAGWGRCWPARVEGAGDARDPGRRQPRDGRSVPLSPVPCRRQDPPGAIVRKAGDEPGKPICHFPADGTGRGRTRQGLWRQGLWRQGFLGDRGFGARRGCEQAASDSGHTGTANCLELFRL
jgi:hypothetical protein